MILDLHILKVTQGLAYIPLATYIYWIYIYILLRLLSYLQSIETNCLAYTVINVIYQIKSGSKMGQGQVNECLTI